MPVPKKKAILFELPTFPRGVISLSLPTVAACLKPSFTVQLIDLNFHRPGQYAKLLKTAGEMHLCGLKVSSQNLPYAAAFSSLAREIRPEAKIVWGGELPSLLPKTCLSHADSIVQGRFEPVARTFLRDFEDGALRRVYEGHGAWPLEEDPIPALELVENPENYLRFMGLPFESSLGCGQKYTLASSCGRGGPRARHDPGILVAA